VFFFTEIAVEKYFDPPKCDFSRGLGASKNFLALVSLAIFYGPLVNYAVIRPLLAMEESTLRWPTDKDCGGSLFHR